MAAGSGLWLRLLGGMMHLGLRDLAEARDVKSEL